MLDLKQKEAMTKTGKSQPKVAEESFSKIIRTEMLLNIPIVFSSPILLLTYYRNSFWKKYSINYVLLLLIINFSLLPFQILGQLRKKIAIIFKSVITLICWEIFGLEAKEGWLGVFFYCLSDSFGRRKKP